MSVAVRATTAARKKIHPRKVSGRIRSVRWMISAVLQALLFLAPWIQWHGRQAVLLDLESRRFYFFDLAFWPQETYFILIILVFLAVTLFAATAVAGRMWCGYACPQTLLTESFVTVERWLEGDRAARLRLEKEPWSVRKASLKLAKWSIWAVMSVWLGITFAAYFVPGQQLLTGNASGFALGIVVFFTALSLFDFGWFREQMCHYVCPYARFQGAMFDSDTLLVAYDAKRGEPRGKVSTPGAGDCVDCSVCVQVCPMGIDIRNGNQLECIACTACLDACDTVMDRVGRPRGLVRYTSLSGKLNLLRPRVIAYAAILVSLAGLFFWLLAARAPLQLDAVRVAAGGVFQRTPDGRLSNSYRLKLINKTWQERTIVLSLQNFPGAQLVTPQNPVVVSADSATDLTVLVVHDGKDLPPVKRFSFLAGDDGLAPAAVQTSFVGPGL